MHAEKVRRSFWGNTYSPKRASYRCDVKRRNQLARLQEARPAPSCCAPQPLCACSPDGPAPACSRFNAHRCLKRAPVRGIFLLYQLCQRNSFGQVIAVNSNGIVCNAPGYLCSWLCSDALEKFMRWRVSSWIVMSVNIETL